MNENTKYHEAELVDQARTKEEKMRVEIMKLIEERYYEAAAEKELENRRQRAILIEKSDHQIGSNDIKVGSP